MSKQVRVTMRKRRLGLELLALRQAARLSQADVAARLASDRSALSNVETGKACPSRRTLGLLLDMYGVRDEAARIAIFALRESANARMTGKYIPETYQEYIFWESRATRLRFFELSLIPGPLQVPEYVGELARCGLPHATPDEINERISIRLERQEQLSQRNATIDAVISEAAIRCAVGGTEVMVAQLLYLVEIVQTSAANIHVLPASAGAHESMSCAFVVLDFDQEPPIISVETPFGELFQDDKVEIARYKELWDSLLAKSLGFRESTELIAAAIEDLSVRHQR